MPIYQIVQTLIGAIIGGGIVLIADWLRAYQKRKKSTQKWFESTYIKKGIDPVITYLLNLRLHIINLDLQNSMQLPNISVVPVEALAKIQILLDDTVVNGIIVLIHSALIENKSEEKLKAGKAALETSKVLLSFRQEMLKISNTKLSNKNYKIDTSLTQTKLNSIFKQLHQDDQHILTWQAGKGKN